MACTNCYNGCAPTIADKCVKYTGVDIPQLNIENGDTLFSVEDNIIIKMLEIMVGDGIIPDVPFDALCSQIHAQLPPVGPITLNDYLIAFAYVICTTANTQIGIVDSLEALEADYTLDCITVDPLSFSTTHNVVQAVIDAFCDLRDEYDLFVTSTAPATYVKISDIDGIIQDYIDSTATGNLIRNKMIPFVAMEYYGTLANFNASGAGIGDWVKVYLCNGANGTPDKRGRVAVGVTTVTGGGAFNPAVDPANPDNPNYTANVPLGANTVTLTSAQLPPHTHTATSTISGITKVIVPFVAQVAGPPPLGSVLTYDSVGNQDAAIRVTEEATVNTSGTVITTVNANTGLGNAHSNVQPVLPCHYIMYIP